jgi:hypothetical protein
VRPCATPCLAAALPPDCVQLPLSSPGGALKLHVHPSPAHSTPQAARSPLKPPSLACLSLNPIPTLTVRNRMMPCSLPCCELSRYLAFGLVLAFGLWLSFGLVAVSCHATWPWASTSTRPRGRPRPPPRWRSCPPAQAAARTRGCQSERVQTPSSRSLAGSRLSTAMGHPCLLQAPLQAALDF